MTERTVLLELARIEALHLSGLVTQFTDLLDESGDGIGDPAIERLTPVAYADEAAAAEFRELTRDDLLRRRHADAVLVLASLEDAAALPDDADEAQLIEAAVVQLDTEDVQAWLRTLAALRLVLASRLGVTDDGDTDEQDPRTGVYEWLGYRLDGLVQALDQ